MSEGTCQFAPVAGYDVKPGMALAEDADAMVWFYIRTLDDRPEVGTPEAKRLGELHATMRPGDRVARGFWGGSYTVRIIRHDEDYRRWVSF